MTKIVAKDVYTTGTITINFTTKMSKEELASEFDWGSFKDGHVSLTNMEGEEIELEIHEYELSNLSDEDF